MSFATRRRLALVIAVALMLAMTLPGMAAAAAGPANAGVAPAAVRSTAVFAPDTYENDDTTVTAKALPTTSYHTLESSATSAGVTDDVDWFKFQVTTTGTPVLIDVNPTENSKNQVLLTLYQGADGNGNLATTTPIYSNGNAKAMALTTATAGWYYGQVVSQAAMKAGAYWLTVNQGDALRLYGADRYATNVAVTRFAVPSWWSVWGNTTPRKIFIASGASYPDALVAGAFCAQADSPLLLTAPTALGAGAKSEIERFARNTGSAVDVYIVGGTAALGTPVETEIKGMVDVDRVVRLSGTDRYGTAAAVADETSKVVDITAGRVFLASGANFADALAAAPIAGNLNRPVLLTQPTAATSATVNWMKSNNTTDVVVCGGPSAIATAVLDAIQASVPGTQTFTRVAGADRYETAYRLARYGVVNGSIDGSEAVVVSGASFPDALSAVNLVGCTFFTGTVGKTAPILLSTPTTMSPWVESFYKDGDGFNYRYGSSGDYIVGGPSAVSAAAFTSINDLWKKPF